VAGANELYRVLCDKPGPDQTSAKAIEYVMAGPPELFGTDPSDPFFVTPGVEEIAKTRVPEVAYVPGVATFEGGLPVMTSAGVHIGSIGVSGAAASDEGICAQAGIDAIASEL